MSKFEKHFPTGQNRKQVVQHTAEEAKYFQNHGQKMIDNYEHYTLLDSSLEGPPGLATFSWSFRDILPEGEKSLKIYIEKVLKERKGNAVGVEFGGPGVNLFEGFESGFFKKSVGVTLLDYDYFDKAHDISASHAVLEGDMFLPKTYEELESVLGGEQVDLIIERMAKGLEFVPPEPYAVSKILAKWYELLREGGIMFVQTPVAFNKLLDEWAYIIKRDYSDVLEINYNSSGWRDENAQSAFRLRKLPGAPKELPFLSPRIVAKTPKDIPLNRG